MRFLPINHKEMEERGWDQVDFVMVTGDAYVDHPSFGTAIITRLLERYGYTIGIISQPDWNDPEGFKVFGEPRLGFLVNSGNIDSMVNHYTSFKKRRRVDAYSPGGETGKRPDRAVIVYGNKIREAYKHTPIIIGGIEASLRRMAHYDYWDDKIRRSILLDSAADLLVYGMGEKAIIEIAEALASGIPVDEITYVRGTVYKTKDASRAYDDIRLPDYETIVKDKMAYADSFRLEYENTDAINGKTLVASYGDLFVIQNPPSFPLTQQEMDDVYALDYEREYHPIYKELGGVPALEEVKFSITSVRGCYGGCSFCSLTFHQGRVIQPRSHESIVKEGEDFTRDNQFKGYIHDVGGPTANFRTIACKKQLKQGVCKHKQCIFPNKCDQLIIDHKDYLALLKKLRGIQGVKKVFIRSGIRYDYVMYDQSDEFLNEVCLHHISGQLKLAPEHISDDVLKYMGKPSFKIYETFVEKYNQINKKMDKKQYIVPYFISGHPGSTLKDAIKLAEYIRDMGHMPEQVQDFYPTPMTLSTCMYYTGVDPRTMKPVYIPKTIKEKRMQRALMQYNRKENKKLVLEALKLAGREDLIGFDKKALIRP
ncbi:MAG: YgiQ family radical SAM protein [Tissierellales bacterium]|nr:YgiQ family radical SAM protein [Tissierellales bacterium]MBN2827088.1 YgiQ family radical SAM protein [Tissierellales bacterium]